jgi:hypothetical protein
MGNALSKMIQLKLFWLIGIAPFWRLSSRSFSDEAFSIQSCIQV